MNGGKCVTNVCAPNVASVKTSTAALVSVIDIAGRQVVKKVPVGHGPWGVAVVAAP